MSCPDYLGYDGDGGGEVGMEGMRGKRVVPSPFSRGQQLGSVMCPAIRCYHSLKCDGHHQSWTGTSQTVSQDELLPMPVGHQRRLLWRMG